MTAPRTRTNFAETPRRVRSTLYGTWVKSQYVGRIPRVAQTANSATNPATLGGVLDG